MKKLLLSVVVATVAIMTTGCKKINDRIDRLDDRLSQLEETTIPSIDEQIDGINNTIESLEKIDAELKGYIKTLQQQAATATEQIKKLQAKDEALEQKIAELRQYVDAEIQKTKDWAETAFATLEQYNGITREIESLKESLKSAGKEAEALKQSIGDLESEIASIKATLAELTKNVEAIKGDIAKLLGRIQSVTYVPKYTDGKVEMKRTMGEDDGIAEFDFAVTPAEAVKELANVWSVAVKMRAVYTETRAVSFMDMPILSFVADESNGVVTVRASGKNLNEDFFIGKSVASASLVISDGNASVASEYVPMFVSTNIVRISLDKTEHTLIVGKSFALNVIAEPSNATLPYVSWLTSDNNVATVSNTGIVTGVAAGNATIIAKISNDIFAECKVTVKNVKTYKIGDIVEFGGEKGIVFWLNEDETGGKAVSFKETVGLLWSTSDLKCKAYSEDDGEANTEKIEQVGLDYHPATKWCVDLGNGWYMPAVTEGTNFVTKASILNPILKANGGTEIKDSSVDWYWSSTEGESHPEAEVICFYGGTGTIHCYGDFKVAPEADNYLRAVHKF